MRRAVILIAAEVLRDGLGPLVDAGLAVFGSFSSHAQHRGVVILGIEGDALPERCATEGAAILEVTAVFRQEDGAAGRIVQVAEISLTGRNVFDLSPDGRQRAA